MKINNKELISGLRNYIDHLRGTERGEKRSIQETKVEAGRDRVEISRRSREAERTRKAIERVPDVNEKKVAKLKKTVEEGTYNVKGEVVAESLIRRSIVDNLL